LLGARVVHARAGELLAGLGDDRDLHHDATLAVLAQVDPHARARLHPQDLLLLALDLDGQLADVLALEPDVDVEQAPAGTAACRRALHAAGARIALEAELRLVARAGLELAE